MSGPYYSEGAAMCRTGLLFVFSLAFASGMQILSIGQVATQTVPTVSLLPEGKMPVVMCGMGGQLYQQLAPVQALTTTWLRLGGRGLDTAEVYLTEPGVPAALEAAGVPSEEVFILTKLHPDISATVEPGAVGPLVRNAVESSLKALNVSHIDLMLIHQPGSEAVNAAMWQELESFHGEGKLKALGVSNFDAAQMQALMKTAKVPIAVNQRQMNVRQKDEAALSFCKQNGIVYQAYGPLGQGADHILSDPTVAQVAAAHNRTTAQVALRWVLQKGAALSVQSESEQHQRDDMQLFGWSLTAPEMSALDGL